MSDRIEAARAAILRAADTSAAYRAADRSGVLAERNARGWTARGHGLSTTYEHSTKLDALEAWSRGYVSTAQARLEREKSIKASWK